MWRRSRIVVALLASFVLAGPVAAASSSGGASIASAPAAPPATTLNGNTSSDDVETVDVSLGPGTACPGDGEFWLLSLTKGDELRLEGAVLAPAAQIYVDVFEPGTTDQSLATTKPLLSDALGDSVLKADRSGKYPVLIGTSSTCGGADGPFHFAALVTHEAIVSLPHVRTVGPAGTFVARVVTPDAQPITDARLHLVLEATYTPRAGAPRKLFTASMTAVDGHTAFPYRLPASARGGEVELRLTAKGAGYQPVRAVRDTVAIR
jgi:hypothetical protein